MRQLTVKNTEPKTPVPSKEPISLPSMEFPVTSAMAPGFAPKGPRPGANKKRNLELRARGLRGSRVATDREDRASRRDKEISETTGASDPKLEEGGIKRLLPTTARGTPVQAEGERRRSKRPPRTSQRHMRGGKA